MCVFYRTSVTAKVVRVAIRYVGRKSPNREPARARTRPAIFKWRQTAPELILCAVRWYLRYSLSLRDVEESFAERGLAADHTTIWRWVQRYGPELETAAAPSAQVDQQILACR